MSGNTTFYSDNYHRSYGIWYQGHRISAELISTLSYLLQIEIHPYFLNRKLVEFCQSKGLSVTAYAPLANANRTW
jgi:diketogulonate reductase-like aldo/keto reductase